MTSIHATGTSISHFPAERATVTARVLEVSKDRNESIEAATRLHNRLVARAEQLRGSGDATWHSADPISTWARKSYAEGAKSTVVVEHVTSSAVRIKLANLALVSELVDELARAGAETDVTWSLTDPFRREVERGVRKAAVAEARAVAEDYAEALGERIERVVSVSDGEGDWQGPGVRAMAASIGSGPAEVTIAEITVSATVAGVFESA